MAAPKRAVGPKSDKEWREALRVEVHSIRVDADTLQREKALRIVARKVVSLALAGDMAAVKEIGDRLDGKPAQTVVGEDGGPPTLVVVLRDLDKEGLV